MDPIIGIDLGTTNSEVAVLEDGRPRVLSEEGRAILPSVVGLSDDGRLLVGEAARNQWLLAPERTIRSVKRHMGQDVKLRMGDDEFSPQEVSAMILRALKDRAERHLNGPVGKAVITVPAYFTDAQRQATREAGELAGLEVVRILNEPTSASLVYEADQSTAQTIMVYDLGGGTFDVSIVKIEAGVVEVLASHGDTHLGGDDFDELLIRHVLDGFREEHGIDLGEDIRARSRLWRAVEEAKRTLSTEPYARIAEDFIAEKDGTPLHLMVELDRPRYEEMIRPLIEKTMDAVQTALKDAGISANQIDRIVLAGGATRTPLISEELQKRTGRLPHQEVDPDLCVAMGAAIQAGIIQGDDVGAVLVDVTPYTFGISYLGERNGMPYPYCFSPIIRKNTPLPTTRTELYYTAYDNQECVEVKVFQGEHPDALKNVEIGRFMVEGLSPQPANNPVTCRLDLDLNGMLKVTAQEKCTGLEKHIVIDNAMSRFEREAMSDASQRLRALFGDEEASDEAQEAASVQADAIPADDPAATILSRARELLPDVPEEDRDEVIRLIEEIDDSLKQRRTDEAADTARELEEILFYLEESR